jgi:kynurenine formamidase
VKALLWLCPLLVIAAQNQDKPQGKDGARIVDLSLLVAAEYPCTWPAGFPLFQINHYLKIGPLSAYNSDILAIDGNTGTQLDAPPHSIPRPGIDSPLAGPAGAIYTEKIPAWQFAGEACVIDTRELLDKGANGHSSLVRKSHIENWEKQHRSLRFGDVALFFSGYTDKYYKPFPAGRRFVDDPLESKSPAWPDPDPEAMGYVASRGVMTAATDSVSMGPIPDLADPTHIAGLKHGMIWTESVTGMGLLPATGAFYCMLGPKYVGAIASEARAFAVIGEPLAGKLIESARNRRAADLSVTFAPDLPISWPGAGVGNNRQPFLTINFQHMPALDNYQQIHMFDSHSGTHLVPPAYALPPAGFDNRTYSPEVRQWLAEYEKQYGARGTSDVTIEKVPLAQSQGWARLIDVNTTEITTADIQKFEGQHGALKAGEIVIFRSGYSDGCMQATAEAKNCMSDALNGKRPGWPAPGPDAIVYLAKKGIRAVGTDSPTLGGVDPKRALMTYWALGSKGMVAVEYLTNLRALPESAYFIFAPIKIRGAHGGPGRAIALY